MKPTRLLILLTTLSLANLALAAPPPTSSEFDGPPIERDTLKKDPESRCKKIWDQLQQDNGGGDTRDKTVDEKGGLHLVDDGDTKLSPAYILAHLDDYRKLFWQTYPDGKDHEEIRESLAQALFLKDIHYLQTDLVTKNLLENTPSKNADLHDGDPEKTAGTAIVQTLNAGALDASINPDGGITKAALPEFEAWVDATRKNLGLIKHLDTNAQLASLFKTDFGILGADYRKACNFSGKEYQAYLIERDWAEYDLAGKIPAGYDNKKTYGIYLYCRNVHIPLAEAKANYDDMVKILGAPAVEAAAEKVLTAPKTPEGKLTTKYPEPYKLGPGGSHVPDYDAPMPTDISNFFTNPLVEMEALATQSDAHAYLIRILKARYFTNLQNGYLKPDVYKWSYAESTCKALCNAFGKKTVLDLAEKIRTAPKRQVGMTIIDPKALGATRNDPLETYEDSLARSDPKGYVKAALAFNQNINDPGSVDVEDAYKKLLAATPPTDEKALLEAAQRCALGDPHSFTNHPRFGFRDELKKILHELASPTVIATPGPQIDDPDFLAWKKFPDNVKVSYVIRGWVPDPRNPDNFAGPSNPSERYTLSVKSRTADLLILWSTEIAYDYPSGAAHPPHDIEIGYNATRSQTTPGRAPSKSRGPARPAQPADAPTIDSGDETLNIAGRSIPTHWTSSLRTYKGGGAGDSTITTKIWTSDEIPGGLVRKTEEKSRTAPPGGPRLFAIHLFSETVLESFQGITPGKPAAKDAPAPAGPPAPAPATQPAPVLAPVPAPLPAAVPTTEPATKPAPKPAPVVRKKPARGEDVSPADIAAKKEIMKRYYAATTRDSQISAQIDANRRNKAADTPKLPPEITKARTDIDAELNATLRAVSSRDNDEAQKQIQAAEDNLTLIEKYLNP